MSCLKSQLSEYSLVDHILRAAFLSRARDAWVIFMSNELAAYFDDSGHPDDKDVVLVAGWVGKVDQWILWERDWRKVLSDYKIQSGIFHMTDFEAGAHCKKEDKNEYKHLTPHQRHLFQDKLINLIATRARFSFCSMVPMHDYKQINEVYCFEEWLGKPYAFAAVSVFQRLRAWKERYAPNDPLVTFFEDGTKHKGDLIDAFKQFRFNDPIFRKKAEVAPLQAADLLAWECFNGFQTGEVRPQFGSVLNAAPGRYGHGIFTWERLKVAADESQAPKRDSSKNVAYYFTSSPKVQRLRKIFGDVEKHRIKGSERSGGSDPAPFP